MTKRQNKGITLIALIITIIVLLILAGVSIAMLTEENGILKQAQTSKERTEKAEAIERAKLDIMEWRADKLSRGEDETVTNAKIQTILTGKDYVKTEEGNPGTESFVSKEGHTILYSELYTASTLTPPEGDTAVVGQIVTGTKNKTYTTEDGTAKIPVGFMIVPGCEDISKGLVISDNPTDDESDENPANHKAEGNQFVWIPVTHPTQYVRNTTYRDVEVSPKAYTDDNYLPDDIQPEIEEGKTYREIGLINEEAEKNAVVLSGGFYIARYEAGDETAQSNRTDSSGTTGTLVIKKNVYVYSYISLGDIKIKSKTFKNNEYVKSALISGIQWDVTMATITNYGCKDGNGKDYDVTKEVIDRHIRTEAKTGQNIADKVYNIYDLEGNFSEFVAEKQSYQLSIPYVKRGGGLYSDNKPASCRRDSPSSAHGSLSFRLVLYVI